MITLKQMSAHRRLYRYKSAEDHIVSYRPRQHAENANRRHHHGKFHRPESGLWAPEKEPNTGRCIKEYDGRLHKDVQTHQYPADDNISRLRALLNLEEVEHDDPE